MKVGRFLLVLVLVGLVSMLPAVTSAVDLGAPGGKKVTVGSEVKRGTAAMLPALDGFDLLRDVGVINSIFSLNRQENTDTPGFMLGASFQAWSILQMKAGVLKGKVRPDEYDLAYNTAGRYFKDFRKRQKELRIDDEKLMELIGFKEPMMNEIYKWEGRVK